MKRGGRLVGVGGVKVEEDEKEEEEEEERS